MMTSSSARAPELSVVVVVAVVVVLFNLDSVLKRAPTRTTASAIPPTIDVTKERTNIFVASPRSSRTPIATAAVWGRTSPAQRLRSLAPSRHFEYE